MVCLYNESSLFQVLFVNNIYVYTVPARESNVKFGQKLKFWLKVEILGKILKKLKLLAEILQKEKKWKKLFTCYFSSSHLNLTFSPKIRILDKK